MNGGDTIVEADTDWNRLDAMTDDEVHAAALSDPDAQPLTPERLARMKRVPRTITMRRAMHLTQEEFAACYQIPVEALRGWEEQRTVPDAIAQTYLYLIAREPEVIRLALAGRRLGSRDTETIGDTETARSPDHRARTN